MNTYRQEKIAKIEQEIKSIKLRLIEEIAKTQTLEQAKKVEKMISLLTYNFEDLQDLKDR